MLIRSKVRSEREEGGDENRDKFSAPCHFQEYRDWKFFAFFAQAVKNK